MTSNGDSKQQVRVILWSVHRTLSTAIEKCFSYVPSTQVIHEPFGCAHGLGPEKTMLPGTTVEDYKKYDAAFAGMEQMMAKFTMAFDAGQCTFQFAKEQLEAEYPGKEVVFCKDMVHGIHGKYDYLPKGYRHTFIIRNPLRTFISQKKMIAAQVAAFNPQLLAASGGHFRVCDMPPPFMPKKYGFEEQWELMQHLQDSGENPIVIDADELLANPAAVLGQFCAQLGIPFSEERLKWPADKNAMMVWKGPIQFMAGNFLPQEAGGYHDAALDSTCFLEPKPLPDRKEVSEDILKCVDASMPFYEKMYALRIKAT